MPDYSKHTDQELLDAIRNDDEGAFSELFKRYGKEVYKMAYSRVRTKEGAEEIVQNLFVALWDRRARLSINNVPSYFYTAVKHRALNAIESLIVHKKYWDYYRQHIPQEENVTEQTIAFNELMSEIQKGIECLPEKPRMVFTLNRLEGHSVQDIAHALNLSEKTVQYHLTRSLKELRLHLKHYLLSFVPFLCYMTCDL